jgi:hypothetical protein
VQSAGAVTVEQELQGHVLVALGKLAVHDASLSSKMAALFLREVERAASPVLRNNLLIILTDLCVRHTALVDPHINKLALCLRDDNEVVRKHALTLITNLLATDYVKWRGTLFFRYLVALVDESLLIREQVDAARKRVLMQARHVHTPSACVHVDSRLLLHTAVSAFHPMSKNLNRGRYARQARQSLFRMLLPKSNFLACSAHFVESVFVFNDEGAGHAGYNTFANCPGTRARTHTNLVSFSLYCELVESSGNVHCRSFSNAMHNPTWHSFTPCTPYRTLHSNGACQVLAGRGGERAEAAHHLRPHASSLHGRAALSDHSKAVRGRARWRR